MKLGIVGFAERRKNQHFSTPLHRQAHSRQTIRFCTIEPNVGMVSVPDERLDKLAEMYEPEKVHPCNNRIC